MTMAGSEKSKLLKPLIIAFCSLPFCFLSIYLITRTQFGSHREQFFVQVSPKSMELKLLTTELHDGRLRPKDDIAFKMWTTDSAGHSVRLIGKSCGCFDVFRNGTEVKVGDEFLLSQPPVELKLRLGSVPRSREKVDQSVTFQSDDKVVSFRASIEISPPLFTIPSAPTARLESSGQFLASRFEVVATSAVSTSLDVGPHIEFASPIDGSCIQVVDAGVAVNFGENHFRKRWLVEARIPSSQMSQSESRKAAVVQVELPGRGAHYELSNVVISVLRSSGLSAPTVVYFGAVSRGAEKVRRVVIRSLDGKLFRIQPLPSSSGNIKLRYEDRESVVHMVEACVVVNDIGDFRESLSVPTTHPDTPLLDISFSGRTVD